MLINETLKPWRDWRGMTQAELSELSGVGRVTISRIEGGRQEPNKETLCKLAMGLSISLDTIRTERPSDLNIRNQA